MAAASKIHDFPSELIVAIAAKVEKSDLLSYRAVCRKWYTASDDTFLNTYFTIRTHLFWDYSLNALKSMSQLPRLAKAIKEIRIVAQCSRLICSPSELDLEPEKHGKEESKDDASDNAEAGYQAIRPRYSNYGNLHIVLQEILSNIANYNRTISFAVSSRASEPAYGQSEFQKLRSIDRDFQVKRDDFGCAKYHGCDHEVPELILDAAARSPIVVDCLDIGYEDRSYGLFPLHTHKSCVSQDPDYARSLKAPFSNLTSVKLGIYTEYWKFGEVACLNLYKSIKEVLQTAFHLQELHVSILPHPSIRAYDSSIAAYGSSSSLHVFNDHYLDAPFPLPQLKKLELKYINASSAGSRQSLLDFIRTFGQTLRHLRLVHLFQAHRSSWGPVIEGLASLPHIELVEICGVDTDESIEKTLMVENFTFVSNGNVEADGERDITMALKNFANDLDVPMVEEESSDDNGEDGDADDDAEDGDADDDGDSEGDGNVGGTSGGPDDSNDEHVMEAA